jgi:hypothetical protein
MLVQATLAAQRGPAATLPQLLGTLQRWFAAEAKGAAGGSAAITPAPSKKDKWAAVKLPEDTVAAIPETTLPGQAFVGDLRSTSGLGLGDGKTSHTSKWLTVRLLPGPRTVLQREHVAPLGKNQRCLWYLAGSCPLRRWPIVHPRHSLRLTPGWCQVSDGLHTGG